MVIQDSWVISPSGAAGFSWLKINVETTLEVAGPGWVCSPITCLIRAVGFRVRGCEQIPTIIDFWS